MLRKFFATACALGALATHAQSEILYRGIIIITSANPACTRGPNVGNTNNVQFHPRGLGNSNFSALTTIWNFGGQSYSLDNANFGTVYKVAKSGGLGWSVYASQKPSSVLLNPLPVITAATATLNLTGKMKNPYGNTDQTACEVGFRAVMYKVVE